MQAGIIDKWSIIVAAGSLLSSWALFWSYTSDPIGSFAAAAIAAGLFFLAYIVVRMVILAFKE